MKAPISSHLFHIFTLTNIIKIKTKISVMKISLKTNRFASLTFIRGSLCPGAVLSPSGSLPSWQVPSCSVSPQERTAKGYSLLYSLTPFYSPFFNGVEICVTTRKAVILFLCVCSKLQKSWNSSVLGFSASD